LQAQDRTSNDWKIEDTSLPVGRLPTGNPGDQGAFNHAPHGNGEDIPQVS